MWLLLATTTDDVSRLVDVTVSSSVRVVKIEFEMVSVNRRTDVLVVLKSSVSVFVVSAVDTSLSQRLIKIS